MKTLVTFSVALLLGAAALSTPSMAQKKPSNEAYYEESPQAGLPRLEAAVFPAADPLKLWMVVAKEDHRASVKVELLNAKNQVLHEEVVGAWQQKFRQRFDLSDMPDGRYTFRISDGHTVQERVFKLSSPGLQEQLPKRLVTMN
jgi:hypothetical protein